MSALMQRPARPAISLEWIAAQPTAALAVIVRSTSPTGRYRQQLAWAEAELLRRGVPALLPCPGCGLAPAFDPAFHGQACIHCDNDDCRGVGDGWPQAMGTTPSAAAVKWNAQAAKHPPVIIQQKEAAA